MTHWYKLLAEGELLITLPHTKRLNTYEKRKALRSFVKEQNILCESGFELEEVM